MTAFGRIRAVWTARSTGAEAGRRSVLAALTGRLAGPSAPTICVLVFRGVSSSEIDLPVTRLADRMGARVVFVGPRLGAVHAVEPSRSVVVETAPAEAPTADVLVVPGGLGWKQVLEHGEVREWLASTAASARGVLAMSTGSWLLASVGGLDGREAAGHWLADGELAALGATVSTCRTATDDGGRVVTASGARAALGVVDALADHVRWAQWAPS